jgi:branched-chain amino acid transport system permease protein
MTSRRNLFTHILFLVTCCNLISAGSPAFGYLHERLLAPAFGAAAQARLGAFEGRIRFAVLGDQAFDSPLVAPATFVSPNAFDPILVFGFAAAVLGGLDSPLGAVVGGLVLGLLLAYLSGYAGSEVVTLGALVVVIVVLMVRPNGLFTSAAGRRV